MGETEAKWLGVFMLFVTAMALVAFPPAGILFAVGLGWWMLRTWWRGEKDFAEKHRHEMEEIRRMNDED